MFNDDEPLVFKKMHEFSTVDGFVEITESLADMIKFIANEPSVGLYYIQQHTQNAVPNLVNLKNKTEEKSRDMTLHTEDSEDSITVIRSMKECGLPIANDMIKDLRHSLAVISKKQPKRGLISGTNSSFPMGTTVTSWSPVTWGRSTGPEDDGGETAAGYLSTVLKSAKQKASNFKWSQLESGESRQARSEASLSDKDEPSNDGLVAADASSSSSSVRGATSEDLRFSSKKPADELQQEQVKKSMSHDQLLSLSENFDEFKAVKEAKLEEWLGGTGNRNASPGE